MRYVPRFVFVSIILAAIFYGAWAVLPDFSYFVMRRLLTAALLLCFAYVLSLSQLFRVPWHWLPDMFLEALFWVACIFTAAISLTVLVDPERMSALQAMSCICGSLKLLRVGTEPSQEE